MGSALVAFLTRECDASSCDRDHTDSHRRPERDGQTPRLVSDQPAPSLSFYSSAKQREKESICFNTEEILRGGKNERTIKRRENARGGRRGKREKKREKQDSLTTIKQWGQKVTNKWKNRKLDFEASFRPVGCKALSW